MIDLAGSEEGPAAAAAWLRRGPEPTERDHDVADLLELYDPADSVPGRALLAAAATAPAGVVGSVAWPAATNGEIELATALMDTLAARDESPPWEPSYRLLSLAGTGRPDSARAWATAIGDERGRSLFTAFVAAAPFVPVDTAALEGARRALATLADAAAGGTDAAPGGGTGGPAGGPTGEELSHVYLGGLADLRLGRDTAALAAADSLDAAADSLPDALRASVRLWARSIRATALAREDDPAAALDALGQVDEPIPFDHAESPLLDRTRERYLLGSLLVAAGRPDDAVPWLEHGIAHRFAALLYLPMAQLRLGEAHEMAGRDDEAVDAYARFLRYFAHAEPSMMPYVRQARNAMVRLTGERGAPGALTR